MPMSDEERRARNREHQRRYVERMKSDPKWMAKQREYHRENRKKPENHARVRARLEHLRKSDPTFKERHRQARRRYLEKHPDRQSESNRKQNAKRAVEGRRRRALEIYKSPRAVDRLYRAARKGLPAGLPPWISDDVISEITLAVFQGWLVEKDIGKRAGEFLRTYNRENDTFKTLSLDAPMGGTDLKRIDLLEAPAPYEPEEDEEDPDLAMLKGGYSRW